MKEITINELDEIFNKTILNDIYKDIKKEILKKLENKKERRNGYARDE